MNEHAVFHLSDTPWAFALHDDVLTVRLRTCRDILKVRVFYKDRYEWIDRPWKILAMEEAARTRLFVYWTGDLELSFELETAEGTTFAYDERGLRGPEFPEPEAQAFQFPYINKSEVYRGKEDLLDAVVYQIFPERFFNGEKDTQTLALLKARGNTKSPTC